MSEAVADFASSLGYDSLESPTLAEKINDWFNNVVELIPPETYTAMPAGTTERLHVVPGLGEISLRYEGASYLPKQEDHPNCPLQKFNYTLAMRADSTPEQPEPVGWWMPLRMVYGPQLALDANAEAEELVGSTIEQRQTVEYVLGALSFSYTQLRQATFL